MMATDPVHYAEQFLQLVDAHAYHRARLNWPAFQRRLRKAARRATTVADLHPVLRTSLKQLGDRHSFLKRPDEELWGNADYDPQPRAHAVGACVQITVPRFAPNGKISEGDYVAALQQILRAHDRPDMRGWIIDLRENTGGNMWPMLAGLGELLATEHPGAFVDRDGTIVRWRYADGRAGCEGYPPYAGQRSAARLQYAGKPIAVLTSARTGSSGEALAIAFRGHPQARSFGAATHGLSTSNMWFRLEDGMELFLTQAVMADRLGVTYGGPLVPDETVADVAGQDAVLAQAVHGLDATPQPAGKARPAVPKKLTPG